jgi:hypothetical protein
MPACALAGGAACLHPDEKMTLAARTMLGKIRRLNDQPHFMWNGD